MKRSIVGLSLFVLLITPMNRVFAQSRHNEVGNMYLLAEYFENIDLDNFDPHKNIGYDAFLLDARSFKINLQNETVTAMVETVAKLPIPTTPLVTKPQKITVDLFYWHTILFVETVSITIEKYKNLLVVIDREVYLTVYGRESKSGKNHYRLLSPRQRVNHLNRKIK